MSVTITTCRGCGAFLTWGRTPAGRLIPLNLEPQRTPAPGTYAFTTGEEVTPATEDSPMGNWHMNHFATCPCARSFRRP